jgi:hypothetical protein
LRFVCLGFSGFFRVAELCEFVRFISFSGFEAGAYDLPRCGLGAAAGGLLAFELLFLGIGTASPCCVIART